MRIVLSVFRSFLRSACASSEFDLKRWAWEIQQFVTSKRPVIRLETWMIEYYDRMLYERFFGTRSKCWRLRGVSGAGNRNAEYGLLFIKVCKFTVKGFTGLRFDTDYGNCLNVLKKISVGNPNKVVKVIPPLFILEMFDRFEAAPKMSESFNIEPRLGKWVHGNENFTWDQ